MHAYFTPCHHHRPTLPAPALLLPPACPLPAVWFPPLPAPAASQLMRVYGALMWSLGKVLNTPEVVRVYIG